MEMEPDSEGTVLEGKSTSTPFAPFPVGGESAGVAAGSSLGSRSGSSASSAKGECSERIDTGDEGGQGNVVPEEGDDVPDEGDDDGSSSEASSDAEETDLDGDDDDGGWSTVSEDDDGTSSKENDDMHMMTSGDGELHPMKNPVILTNLFALCPPSLLANFRLVCKQWRDLSMESWRSSVTLIFGHNCRGRLDLDDDDDYGSVPVPLKEFLKYVKTPKNQCLLKPFRRFRFEGFAFPLSAKKQQLWEFVKRGTKALSLDMCSFRDVEGFRKVIYRDCPVLQQLVLGFCRVGNPPPSLKEVWLGPLLMFWRPTPKEPIPTGVYPEQVHLRSLVITVEDMEKFPLSWLELFSQFPSLSQFSLTLLPDMSDDDDWGDEADTGFPTCELLSLLQAIKTVREKDPRKLPLKQVALVPFLDISHDDEEFLQIFSRILELSFPLEALKLRMDGVMSTQVKLEELTAVADIDGSPLRYLTFYKTASWVSTCKFPFPEPLENLEKLAMNGIIWENMGFLKLVPNLRRLVVTDEPPVLEQYPDSKKSLAMISPSRNPGLADIRLLKMTDFTCNYALSEGDLRRLASWFPNLLKLHTVLNDKLLAIICEQWPALVLLFVIGAKLTDEGITGLRAGQIVEDLDTMELPPNIRLLQNLQSFKYPKSDEVSDVSIFNGFLKLPHLHYLHLGKTKGLSKRAKAALRKKRNIFLEI